eukprot:jgi/Chrzof1/2420/Cz11g14210.t1
MEGQGGTHRAHKCDLQRQVETAAATLVETSTQLQTVKIEIKNAMTLVQAHDQELKVLRRKLKGDRALTVELNSPLQASEARAATLLAKVENKSWQKAGLQQQLRVAVACKGEGGAGPWKGAAGGPGATVQADAHVRALQQQLVEAEAVAATPTSKLQAAADEYTKLAEQLNSSHAEAAAIMAKLQEEAAAASAAEAAARARAETLQQEVNCLHVALTSLRQQQHKQPQRHHGYDTKGRRHSADNGATAADRSFALPVMRNLSSREMQGQQRPSPQQPNITADAATPVNKQLPPVLAAAQAAAAATAAKKQQLPPVLAAAQAAAQQRQAKQKMAAAAPAPEAYCPLVGPCQTVAALDQQQQAQLQPAVAMAAAKQPAVAPLPAVAMAAASHAAAPKPPAAKLAAAPTVTMAAVAQPAPVAQSSWASSSSAQGKKAGKQRRKGNKGKELPALRKPEVQAVVGDGNCAFRAVVQAAHVVDNKDGFELTWGVLPIVQRPIYVYHVPPATADMGPQETMEVEGYEMVWFMGEEYRGRNAPLHLKLDLDVAHYDVLIPPELQS